MPKFKRYDGYGHTAITIGGVLRHIGPGHVVEVDENDEAYNYLVRDKRWSLVSEVKVKINDKKIETPKIELKEKINLIVEDLTKIKGIGQTSAILILNGKNLTWSDLKEKGIDYFEEILKDDIAEVLWEEVIKNTNGGDYRG